MKKGYITIVYHDCYDYYGENVIRISKTTDLDKFIKEANTMLPTGVNLKHAWVCNDINKALKLIYNKFADDRFGLRDSEFFQLPLEEASTVIMQIVTTCNMQKRKVIHATPVEVKRRRAA